MNNLYTFLKLCISIVLDIGGCWAVIYALIYIRKKDHLDKLVAEGKVMNDAKRQANKRWAENNKDKVKYYRYRTSARCFIKNYATIDDLEEIQELMRIKLEGLKENNK